MFEILFIFFTFFQGYAFGTQAKNCIIGIMPACDITIEGGLEYGKTAGLTNIFNIILAQDKPELVTAGQIKSGYFDQNDLDSGTLSCKDSELSHPKIKTQVFDQNEIKQLLVFHKDRNNHKYFKLVDISKITNKTPSNILPVGEGGTNTAIIAEGDSQAGDFNGLKQIIETLRGCDTNLGTIVADGTVKSYSPNIASNQGASPSGGVLADAVKQWKQKCDKLKGKAHETCGKDAYASLDKIRTELEKLKSPSDPLVLGKAAPSLTPQR